MEDILEVLQTVKVGERTIAVLRDKRTDEEFFFFDGGTVLGPFDAPEEAAQNK